MSLIYQQIEKGQVVGNTTAASNVKGDAKTKSTMNENKEMFLKLLVAEMQYQDPMEPKDNSEYVKELSQFTQVETLNSMQDEVEKLSAHTLVGKYVSVNDSQSDKQVEGKVDFVSTQSGTTYVSVEGALYKVADIESVSDSNYFEDTTLASNVDQLVSMLPDESRLTLQDADKIAQVKQAYNGLSDKAKSYVAESTVNRLDALSARITEMQDAARKFAEEEAVKAAAAKEETAVSADKEEAVVQAAPQAADPKPDKAAVDETSAVEASGTADNGKSIKNTEEAGKESGEDRDREPGEDISGKDVDTGMKSEDEITGREAETEAKPEDAMVGREAETEAKPEDAMVERDTETDMKSEDTAPEKDAGTEANAENVNVALDGQANEDHIFTNIDGTVTA